MRRALVVCALVALFAGCKPRDDDSGITVVTASEGEVAAAGSDQPLPSNADRAPEGRLIPRSMADKGKYYLLESKRTGDIVKAVHKRVGVDAVGWTRTETNCKTMRMREMGYTEEGRHKIPYEPTKWFGLVEGSSKSDMARFLCGR